MDVVQNEWQQGEFECMKDMKTCLCGFCCPLCLYCQNASDLGESVPLYCLIACICSPIGICLLRQKARNKYGIEGDDMTDLLCSWCCPTCVLCQTGSEVKRREGRL